MYDEFLRSNNKITINLDDKNFSKHVKKTIELFEFWYDYLNSNPVLGERKDVDYFTCQCSLPPWYFLEFLFGCTIRFLYLNTFLQFNKE